MRLLHRLLGRESGRIVAAPALVASHLHNLLIAESQGDQAEADLCARARRSLEGRPWLRLVNRPRYPAARSAGVAVLDYGVASSISWSPDGGKLAAAGGDAGVRVWETSHWQQVGSPGDGCRGTEVAFSPDGARLALASEDGLVRVWSTAEFALEHVLEGHDGPALSLAWSDRGTVLASGGADRTVRVWDLDSSDGSVLFTGSAPIGSLAWSPQGNAVAAGSERVAWLLDSRDGAVTARMQGAVRGLTFSPDGTLIASGGADPVRLSHGTSGKRSFTLTGHRTAVLAVAWSPVEAKLASASADRSVVIWSVEDRKRLAVLHGHTNKVLCVAFDPLGRLLASGGLEGTIRVWRVPEGDEPAEAPEPRPPARAIRLSPDGRVVAAGGDLGRLAAWDVASGESTLDVRADFAAVTGLAWRPDGTLLASTGLDGKVRLWLPDAWDQAGELGGQEPLAWAPGGDLLAAAGPRSVLLWDVDRLHLAGVLPVPDQPSDLRWSPDGSTLAVLPQEGLGSRTVTLFDVRTLRPRSVLSVDARRVAWSPDGRSIATGCREAPIRLWDADSGAVTVSLGGPGDKVHELEWSPVGGHLTAICGGKAYVWAVAGEPDPVELGSAAGPLAWSPDGERLFLGKEDGTVRLWRRSSPSAAPFAFCLSGIADARFGRDGNELWLVDDGQASANRPIPYRFELANFPETRPADGSQLTAP